MTMISIGSDGRPLGVPVLAAFLDEKNGLMWAANDVADHGLTFSEAEQACKEFHAAGFDDWRLPTIDELERLRDRSRCNPAADPALGLKSIAYWSSTPAAASPSDCAWLVYFSGGSSYWGSHDLRHYVRAVRSVPRASQ